MGKNSSVVTVPHYRNFLYFLLKIVGRLRKFISEPDFSKPPVNIRLVIFHIFRRVFLCGYLIRIENSVSVQYLSPRTKFCHILHMQAAGAVGHKWNDRLTGKIVLMQEGPHRIGDGSPPVPAHRSHHRDRLFARKHHSPLDMPLSAWIPFDCEEHFECVLCTHSNDHRKELQDFIHTLQTVYSEKTDTRIFF